MHSIPLINSPFSITPTRFPLKLRITGAPALGPNEVLCIPVIFLRASPIVLELSTFLCPPHNFFPLMHLP